MGYLADYAAQGIPVVGTSTSCTLTLKEEAPELLDMQGEASEQLKMGTWDIFEWLSELVAQGQFRTDFKNIEMVLPYHCLLYTSDAADERSSVDLGGRRIIKKTNSERTREKRFII